MPARLQERRRLVGEAELARRRVGALADALADTEALVDAQDAQLASFAARVAASSRAAAATGIRVSH